MKSRESPNECGAGGRHERPDAPTLWLPPQASTFARRSTTLHYFVITVTMLASIVTGLLAFYFFFRYRARRDEQSTPLVLPS